MEPILLLHGAIGAKDQLQPLAEKLKNKFDVHTISFNGHGGEPMPETFSIELFAQHVLDYLVQNKIESIHLFGYSMGGYVSLYLAKHYPEKVIKVFSFAAKFHWTPEISLKETKMMNANKIEEKIPAFAKTLEQRHYPNDWKMVLKRISEMLIRVGNATPLNSTDFKTIQQPVLIGTGDKDTTVTLEESIEVYRQLPNALFIVFPNTPHPIEKISVDRLSEEIIRFFK